MKIQFKEYLGREERFSGGHRMCAGCGAPVVVRAVMRALHPGERAVVGCATGCLEVSSFTYPYSSWTDSFIHSAFENAAATISGVEGAYRALVRRGKQKEPRKFITFGGDGGSYDIGFQSLSGAMERGHDMVYVCYDNGAYMNTGIQRSSGTPLYADTTTSPAGQQIPGKLQNRKDLTKVMAAHNIPYVGQTAPTANFKDIHEKAYRAIHTSGSAFINVFAPCPRGWRYEAKDLMKICKLATDTCVWPLYEVVEGNWKLSYEPKNKLPVEDYLRSQGRFKHLFKAGNEDLIAQIQKTVDTEWERLKALCR